MVGVVGAAGRPVESRVPAAMARRMAFVIDQLKPSGTAVWFNAPPPYHVTWAAAVFG